MGSKPFRSPSLPAPEPAAAAGAPATGYLPPRAGRLARVLRRVQPEVVLLAGLAAVLNLWALSRNGFANDYYAAAVRSMSADWHDFLFASMDPRGVMSVDKPPLALWVQALSARIFGYSSLSLLVPQALMGIASVLLIYDLVRARFGRLGGFVAGLTLALTPITVAISRHNNPDALLILCCVAALWFGLRGLKDGRARWLVLAGTCVGLGFETKMLIALVVVPGLVAAWLWMAPGGRIKALRGLLLGGLAMLIAGGAWPLLVELTPASARPWVSGTGDDRVLSLIFEYNGFGRIDGQVGGVGGVRFGPGGSVFGGTPGPLRLLNSALGGQAGWLLGLALVGAIALPASTRLRRSDPRSGWLLAVGGSFAVTAVILSGAKGIFHPYYVSLLAPFSAALIGALVSWLAGARPDRIWVRLVGAGAILAGMASELVVLHDYPGDLAWLTPVLACACVLSAVTIAMSGHRRGIHLALAGALTALLIGPAVWSFQTLGHATSGTFPAGGPVSAQADAGPPGAAGGRAFGLGRGGAGRLPSPAAGTGQPLFGVAGEAGSRPQAEASQGAAGAGPGRARGRGRARGQGRARSAEAASAALRAPGRRSALRWVAGPPVRRRSPTRSPTSSVTEEARWRSPASPPRQARSCRTAPTSPASAGSRAVRATSASPGLRWRYARGASAGSSAKGPGRPARGCRATTGSGRASRSRRSPRAASGRRPAWAVKAPPPPPPAATAAAAAAAAARKPPRRRSMTAQATRRRCCAKRRREPEAALSRLRAFSQHPRPRRFSAGSDHPAPQEGGTSACR